MQWLNWDLGLLILASSLYVKSVAGLPYPIPQSGGQGPSQPCKTTDNVGNVVDRPGCRIESDTVIQELPADIKATEDSANLDSTDQNAIPQHGKRYSHIGAESKRVLISYVKARTTMAMYLGPGGVSGATRNLLEIQEKYMEELLRRNPTIL
ncbi:MAG: hypothetical protein Q9221_003120 [Calogaya cf. arnoldii]